MLQHISHRFVHAIIGVVSLCAVMGCARSHTESLLKPMKALVADRSAGNIRLNTRVEKNAVVRVAFDDSVEYYPQGARVRTSRDGRYLRVSGPGYWVSYGISHVRNVARRKTGLGWTDILPHNGKLSPSLTQACDPSYEACDGGSGAGGCSASFSDCGPCADCTAGQVSGPDNDIDCVDGYGTCGDTFGQPRFHGQRETCIYDFGTDYIDCAEISGNIFNFAVDLASDYVWRYDYSSYPSLQDCIFRSYLNGGKPSYLVFADYVDPRPKIGVQVYTIPAGVQSNDDYWFGCVPGSNVNDQFISGIHNNARSSNDFAVYSPSGLP